MSKHKNKSDYNTMNVSELKKYLQERGVSMMQTICHLIYDIPINFSLRTLNNFNLSVCADKRKLKCQPFA